MFTEKLTSSQFSLPYDTETKGIMNDKQETTEQSKVHEGGLKSGEKDLFWKFDLMYSILVIFLLICVIVIIFINIDLIHIFIFFVNYAPDLHRDWEGTL